MKLLLLVCKCKLSKSFPLPIFHMRQWLKTANLVSWRHTVGLTGHHLLGSIWHITHNLGKYRTGLHCYCSHKGERWQGEFMRSSSDGSQKQNSILHVVQGLSYVFTPLGFIHILLLQSGITFYIVNDLHKILLKYDQWSTQITLKTLKKKKDEWNIKH